MAFLSFFVLHGLLVLVAFATLLWQISSIVTAIYIFKDAQSRGMKAGKWVWLSLLSLLGLIIYITGKKDGKNSKCPACGCEIKTGWDFCPVCSADLTGLQKETVAQQSKAPLKGAIALYVLLPLVVCVCQICAVIFPSSSIDFFKKQNYTVDELMYVYNPAYEWVTECEQDEEYTVFADYNERADVAIIYTKGWIAEGAELKLSGKSNFFGIRRENLKHIPMNAKCPTFKIHFISIIVSDSYNITVVRDVLDGFDCVEAYSGDEQVNVKITKEGVFP